MTRLPFLALAVLRVAVVCLFLGYAWQCVIGGRPFALLLAWSSAPVVNLGFQFIFTSVFCLAGLSAWIIREERGRLYGGLSLGLGILGLGVLGAVHWTNVGFVPGALMGFACRIAAPLALLLAVSGWETRHVRTVMLVGIALAFTGHGLAAMELQPQPPSFSAMVMAILGLDMDQARQFLQWAGTVDILVSVALFIPLSTMPALVYAAVWGVLTAMARPVSTFMTGGTPLEWPWQEMLIRLPHGLLPVVCLMILWQGRRAGGVEISLKKER